MLARFAVVPRSSRRVVAVFPQNNHNNFGIVTGVRPLRLLSSTAAAPATTSTHAKNDNAKARSATAAYPRLFSPLDLGPDIGILPNRALMGSMHTGLEGTSMPRWVMPLIGESDHDDSLDRMAVYFRERALGGVGLMITGGISPNMQGWVSPFSSQLTSEQEMLQHVTVTDAVHSVQVPMGYGGDSKQESVTARICLQILHTGR